MSERHNGSDQAKRAFFGRRKGHALKPRQAALFDTALPRLALDLTKPAPVDLRALFDISLDEVRLEIGFGGAEHLIAQAQAHPRSGFIGSDAFVNAIGKALAAIDADKLGNIRLHFGDASALIDWLPAGALARIDLLYPDPWPKRRHWKRRFVQDLTVAAMARVLTPDGEFRFVSDIDDYCAWTLWHLSRSPDFVWTAERASDWRLPWADYTMTRYGAKAEREGRQAAYLRFRKTG
jgi:tRNA (guanine-N7-)-methyltransferase